MTARQHALDPDLMAAFEAYETALMGNDTAALDACFVGGPATLRGDGDGLLVGHDAISRFRAARGGAAPRRLVAVEARSIGSGHALVVAVTENAAGGRGLQSQLWQRGPLGWQIAAAHVSAPPAALDTRVWRAVGDPLCAPTGVGNLAGETVAVKDLFAVAGFARGAGNPAWLASAPIETTHAHAVERLLAAGAAVRGIACTDEFAYSLSGCNAHSGTPPNPRAPGRIPGGSTSGPASAVALGQASIALGTDTAGSIRVPAAYQGLFGIRTSHGAVDRTGLLPLAPTFDTIGWLTRSAELLELVGATLLPADTASAGPPAVVPLLAALADTEVAGAVDACAARLGASTLDCPIVAELPGWLAAFQTVQRHEAWRMHGDWLASRLDTLGLDVRARFEAARDTTDDVAAAATATLDVARAVIRSVVSRNILVLPTTATVAPFPAGADGVRDRTLQLTCLASFAGAAVVNVPLVTAAGLPCGASLIGPAGSDRAVLAMARELGS